jgi:HlyD family secretion protein
MRYCYKIIILGLSVLTLSACHHKNASNDIQNKTIVIAASKAPVQRLYFSGTLAPISVTPVISAVAGNITALHFTYGSQVKQSQQLLVIDSKQLSQRYRKAISDYLQKKQSFITGKTTFSGTQALYKAGVIAKNEYMSGKTQFENQALDFLESKDELEKVLRTANIKPEEIESLTLADTNKVNALLERHFRHLTVSAPATGIALFPAKKSSDDSSANAGKLAVGDPVKEGQLLLSIGDLSGLSASFDVSEIDIDRIKKGMPVTVTGDAFPGIRLHGTVSAVSAQAKQNSGQSGLSLFVVNVQIPAVSQSAMEKIRVGMTAKFEIDITSPQHILLPISAVFQKNGVSMVRIVDAQGKQNDVPVVTGETTATQVVIISGVTAGEKVVIH